MDNIFGSGKYFILFFFGEGWEGNFFFSSFFPLSFFSFSVQCQCGSPASSVSLKTSIFVE